MKRITLRILALLAFVWAVVQSPIVALVSAVSGFLLLLVVAKWALRNNANPRELRIVEISED